MKTQLSVNNFKSFHNA